MMSIQPIILSIATAVAISVSFSSLANGREQNSNNTHHHFKYKKHPKHKEINHSGYARFKAMTKAMGGLQKILSFKGMEFTSRGNRVEPEQSFKPGGQALAVLNYDYTIINSFTDQRSRTDWLHDSQFPIVTSRQFTEIINGDNGAIFGFDTIIAPPQAPMLSTRIGARVKQNLLSSPLALIHRANRYAGKIRYQGIASFQHRPHYVITIPGWDQTIRFFIDVASNLPSKVDTLEDDSVYGDTRWEVIFKDWIEVNNLKLPSRLIHKINGRKINSEARDNISLRKKLNSDSFIIPDALLSTFNPDQFAWGIRSSQWFNRTVAFGIPFDLDQRTAATLQIVEVAPKVFHARAITHHSMVIEMSNYLIVAEAPLYDERAQVLLTAIKQRWPTKPIKYLLTTHFHNDHIGGVRGFANTNATLIIGEGTRQHYKNLYNAPHTVYPDRYSKNPHKVKITTVTAGKELILTDGTRKVRIFDVQNSHASGMLLAFVEDANLIFVSDLYSPKFFPTTVPQQFLSWSKDLLAALSSNTLDIRWIVGGHGGVSSYDEFVTQIESSL